MKYEKYVSLIKSLEVYAAQHPQSYQNRVAALAFLGYAYIIGLIVLCILLPLLIVTALLLNISVIGSFLLLLVKLWWLVLPGIAVYFSFLAGAIKSLTAKVPDPEGNEIARADASELFDFVEKTCDALAAQKPEKILINDVFNASIVTTPRFGIFGRRVFLILGLPLMNALSPEQFRAVLTHEIGHISGKHGSFSKWAYQLHEAWGRFIESQELQQHKLAALYEKFVNWFFPYFTAYSFVLMRKHEREAGDYAVQLVGAQPLGEALINLETKGTTVSQNFWQEVFEENTQQEKPPTQLFSRMALAFRRQNVETETQSLSKAIESKTDYGDTHPCLADRLQAIGYWTSADLPELPEPTTENAAHTYLGELVEKYTKQFDREWQEKTAKNWKANYDRLQDSQKRLSELAEKESLSFDELFEKAGLVAERNGNREALPLIRQLLEIQPDHAETNYIYGGMLLETDNEEGFKYLNKAMHLDSRLKFPASEIAFNYLRLKGRHDEAKPYVELLESERETIQRAEQERNSINPTDGYELHKLPAEAIEKIVKKLSYNIEVKSAYLVGKAVQYLPEIPLHILFLDLKSLPKKSGAVSSKELTELLAKYVGDLGVQYVYAFGSNENQFREKIATVENSKIYEA